MARALLLIVQTRLVLRIRLALEHNTRRSLLLSLPHFPIITTTTTATTTATTITTTSTIITTATATATACCCCYYDCDFY
eukprot:1727695-Pyramimonas_sp.AAC.1